MIRFPQDTLRHCDVCAGGCSRWEGSPTKGRARSKYNAGRAAIATLWRQLRLSTLLRPSARQGLRTRELEIAIRFAVCGGLTRGHVGTRRMWRCVCALVLLCAAFTRCNGLKSAEMSTVPFVLGSRYGRSPPRMIAPRNDRFFMGSRYGKRSENSMLTALRSLQSLPQTPSRYLSSICELPAFAPLCSRSRAATKAHYNRLDQRYGDKTAYED
ncbi:unnamed protein product, partial [Iphiclides podalirius]